MNILITGACGVTSRTIARSLKKSTAFKEARLVGTDVCYNLYGLYEGLFDRIYKVPWYHTESEYEQAIGNICRYEGIDAAIVVPELEVLFWTKHPFPVTTLLPPPKFSRAVINKASLYQMLDGTGLVPKFTILGRNEIRSGSLGPIAKPPFWMRDFSEGSTSGKGSIKIKQMDEATAWLTLNPTIKKFMVSEYLPGRNLACLLLFYKGRLIKIGCYERLEYFMAKTVISGVSGNISKGRLVNDRKAVETSIKAIEAISRFTGETMSGMVTVDLRSDATEKYLITEINLRQVAAASTFAEIPGANITEAHLFATLGKPELAGELEVTFPENNLILRDIDGVPILVPDFKPLSIGMHVDPTKPPTP